MQHKGTVKVVEQSCGGREGLIVNQFKKGDREDPGNYRGITLLSVVGKVFCKDWFFV